MSDLDLRALERDYLAGGGWTVLETWARAAGRAGFPALERYRDALEAAGNFGALARYFWRVELVRIGEAGLVPVSFQRDTPELVGLEPGDVLQKTGRRKVERFRVLEITERGGRVTVASLVLDPKTGVWSPELVTGRRGNRGAKWMGVLREPFDPRRRVELLEPGPPDRRTEMGRTRATWRELVRGILERTWCLGDSEDVTRRILKDALRYAGSHRDEIAMWLEARALTGWLPKKGRGGEPEPEPEALPLFDQVNR